MFGIGFAWAESFGVGDEEQAGSMSARVNALIPLRQQVSECVGNRPRQAEFYLPEGYFPLMLSA